MVGSKKVMEWNNMMENFGGYSDTGTSSLKALVFGWCGFYGCLRRGRLLGDLGIKRVLCGKQVYIIYIYIHIIEI